MLRNSLEDSTVQKQVLAPAQQYSLHILQMGVQELFEHLREQEMENPMLEIQAEYSVMPYVKNTLFFAKDDDRPDMADRGKTGMGQSFHDFCMEQCDVLLTSEELHIMETVVDSLDANGFLPLQKGDIAELAGCTEELAGYAIDYLKTFEPAGVGAQCLEECLTLQLKRRGVTDPILFSIVCQELPDVAAGYYRKLAMKYRIPETQVWEYIRMIRALDPRPCAAFIQSEPQYIFPDYIIETSEDGIRARALNDYEVSVHELQIEDGAKDAQTEEYLEGCRRHASMIRQAVLRRQKTMEDLVKYLMGTQREYFLGTGPMRAIQMSHAADALGVSVSTISRCVSGKYIQCRAGMLPMRRFFYSSTAGETARISDVSIKQELAAMLTAEDKKHPLSDQKLADLLGKRGIHLSRRTVAKYRAEMGILNTSARRQA